MKGKYRNWFLLFGVASVVLMLLTMEGSYEEVRRCVERAGLWLPAVLLLWAVVYLLNAAAWYLIICDEGRVGGLSFGRVYKLSVSGFALNYTTPCGLMGGEPYRIMELTPYVGVSKATSSVILYVMMHIFSHFWLWIGSVALYVACYPVGWGMGLLLAAVSAACLAAIGLFAKGYRTGMTRKALRMVERWPWIGQRARRWGEGHGEVLARIDAQIAMLHKQHKRTFYCSLLLELGARVLSALEIYFVLRAFGTGVDFKDAVLILAFSSLFSNLIFFLPMQIGAREGGLALAVEGLHLTGALGLYTGLVTRLRELCWIVVGIALIKVGNGGRGSLTERKEEPGDGKVSE